MTVFSLLLCAMLLEASTSFTNPITVGANPHYLKPIIKKTHEQRTPSGLFCSSERGPPYTNIVSAPAQKIIDKHNHVIYRPAIDQGEVDHTSKQQTAFVLLPGCFLEPEQYGSLALAIQNQSTHPAWIIVPKLFANMANPLTLPQAVTEAMDSLHSLGYPSENKVFVGGHSLGGIFIPHLLEQLDPDTRQSIAGTIQLGSFVMRQHREGKDLFFRAQDMLYKTIPRLTLAGDVDGLIRSSRIAEDIRHHVLDPINAGRDADQTRLNHTVILVPGMNHFQIVNTSIAHFLEKSRDLEPEISKEEAISLTASAICEFMEVHQIKDDKHDQRKKSLLEKIKNTEDYLGPLIDAMELEGNHHLDKPCYLATDEDSASCLVGSPFVEGIQQHVTPKEVVNDIYIGDRSCTSWYFNPFADPPFYHPSVTTSRNNRYKVKLNTYSEAIYELPDYLFDGGFFSNTALEIQSKLNSPQAIMDAFGVTIPFEGSANTASSINQMTIQDAFDSAPEIVRNRYIEHGRKLQAGQDIEHKSGPSWILSRLDYSKKGACEYEDDELCHIVDSHTLSTEIDHPLTPGKLYCKLISPARALEWMYTDSLRKH